MIINRRTIPSTTYVTRFLSSSDESLVWESGLGLGLRLGVVSGVGHLQHWFLAKTQQQYLIFVPSLKSPHWLVGSDDKSDTSKGGQENDPNRSCPHLSQV